MGRFKRIGVENLSNHGESGNENPYRGWIAYADRDSITVYPVPSIRGAGLLFTKEQFLVDGVLPGPAA